MKDAYKQFFKWTAILTAIHTIVLIAVWGIRKITGAEGQFLGISLWKYLDWPFEPVSRWWDILLISFATLVFIIIAELIHVAVECRKPDRVRVQKNKYIYKDGFAPLDTIFAVFYLACLVGSLGGLITGIIFGFHAALNVWTWVMGMMIFAFLAEGVIRKILRYIWPTRTRKRRLSRAKK